MHAFPWVREWGQVEQRKASSNAPNIRFYNDSVGELVVERVDDEHYTIKVIRNNSLGLRVISPDYFQNPEGLSIDMVLEHFYTNGEVPGLRWESLAEVPHSTSFAFDKEKWRNAGITVAMMVLLQLGLFVYGFELFSYAPILVLPLNVLISVIWLPELILLNRYGSLNENATFTVENEHTFVFTGKGGQRTFHRDEIVQMTVVNTAYHPPWRRYRYIEVRLAQGKPVYLTFFMTGFEQLPAVLRVQFEEQERVYPNIKRDRS